MASTKDNKPVRTLQQNNIFEGHDSVVLSTDVDLEGTMLATTSLDCKIRIFDLRTAKLICSATSQVGPYSCVKFSPDGNYFISSSRSGDVHVFDVKTGKMLKTYGTVSEKKRHSYSMSVAYSPNGKLVASGHVSGVVSVISTDSGEIVRTFQNHRMAVRTLTFSHDSKCLIAGSDDKYAHVYDLEKNKLIHECTGHRDGIFSIDIHPKMNQVFASGSSDKQIKIWDLTKQQREMCVLAVQTSVEKIRDIKWSPFGDQIAVVGESSVVEVYNIQLN